MVDVDVEAREKSRRSVSDPLLPSVRHTTGRSWTSLIGHIRKLRSAAQSGRSTALSAPSRRCRRGICREMRRKMTRPHFAQVETVGTS